METVKKYAADVLNGTIPACEFVQLACRRFFYDLEREDIEFSEQKYKRALRFIEAQRHTKGQWKGQLFLLQPWQKFIIANIFGFLRLDGTRRYRRAYLEMPKKQGKSPLAAAIGNYMTVADNEGSAECYSIATKLDQASIPWRYAGAMIKGYAAEYELEVSVQDSFNNRRIIYEDNIFMPLAYDEGDKNDGLSPSFGLIEEFHAHRTHRGYAILADGMAARPQPLLLAITTAGFDRNCACYEHRKHCIKVLRGVLDDDELFALIYTIDEGDEKNWFEEAVMKKGNPNWGVSVDPSFMLGKVAEAKESPSKLISFLTKQLNVWTDAEKTWIPFTTWQKGGERIEYSGPCWGGLDLASVHDFAAFTLAFPYLGGYKVLTRYYLPDQTMRDRTDDVGMKIRKWAQQGLIVVTPGNATDYDFIRHDILQLQQLYDIKSIAYDRWNSSQLVIQLQDDGFEMIPFGQGFASMSAPTKTIDRLASNWERFTKENGELESLEDWNKKPKIWHNGNPVTEWMIGNVSIRRDPSGAEKIDKEKSTDKVDGPVSIAMAIGNKMNSIDEDNTYNPISWKRN